MSAENNITPAVVDAAYSAGWNAALEAVKKMMFCEATSMPHDTPVGKGCLAMSGKIEAMRKEAV
jgi:hypothetical protein